MAYLNVLKHRLIDSGLYDLKRHFGVKADGNQDATALIQDAINALNDGDRGGTLLFPVGEILIGGPLDPASNAQLTVPQRDYRENSARAGNGLPLKFMSHGMVNFTDGGYIGGIAKQHSGTVLQSTIQGTGSLPAIIGGGIVNGEVVTNVDFSMENITLRNLSNNGAGGVGPTMSGVNASRMFTARFKSVVVDLDVYGFYTALPQANTYGIIGVANGLDTFNVYQDVLALGYRTGIRMSEHCSGDQIQAFCCYNGIELLFASHSSSLGRVCLQWCRNGLYAYAGENYMQIQSLDLEVIDVGHWYDNGPASGGAHVLDPSSLIKGGTFFNMVNSNAASHDNSLFVKVGGLNFNTTPATLFAATGGTVTPPTAPAAPTNVSATGMTGQNRIAWTASSGATSYKVLRSSTPGGTFAQIGTATASPYDDTTAAVGTDQYYQVQAVNSAGTSPNSATAGPAQVQSGTPVPSSLVWEEDNPGIRYSNGIGTWAPQSDPAYLGGSGRFNNTIGCYYEVTIPPGYTQVQFGGIKEPYACAGDVLKNGNPIATGTCYAPALTTGTYFNIVTGVPGDVITFRNTGAGGNGTDFFCDRIYFWV